MFKIVRSIAATVISVSLALTSSVGVKTGLLTERNVDPVEKGVARVMTFNMKGKYDSERIGNALALIARYYPDSIGLQECTYDMYLDILKKLPEYGFIGVGRENGKRNENCGEMNAILYRKDLYIPVDSGTFWLSETPDTPSKSWNSNCIRICTWAVLENIQTGKTYAHVNTHLDHKSAEAKKQGLAMVAEKALSFSIPTVVTGDFNFTEQSSLYTKNLQKTGLIDTRAAAPDTMNGITYHNYDPDSQKSPHIIDYILVNSRVSSVLKYKIVTEKINGQFVSDHYPVMAEMRLW